MSTLFDLGGRVVVVTGALGRLGLNFCRGIAGHGGRVVALDMAEESIGAPRLSGLIGEGKALYLKADVTDKASLARALAEVARVWEVPFGLVNNAALDSPPDSPAEENGPFETYPEKSLDNILEVNTKGVVLACQVFGGAMAAAGRGSIVNISSIYAMQSPRQPLYDFRRRNGEVFYKPVAYSVSKSALLNLTRYLATYWATKGVRVNTLTFGGVFDNQPQEFLDGYHANVPMGRMARPDEYNGAVVFLMADASSYMTGSNMVIDGGLDRMVTTLGNWIGGRRADALSGKTFEKISPHDGTPLSRVARSQNDDVTAAVAAARAAQPAWAAVPPVQRGNILHAICNALEARSAEIAAIVAAETGKSMKDALGETGGAIALGRFYAGEGQRLYGRTTTSGTANKHAMTVRTPCGVAALIIAANTPIANVAWKVFPALICGNAAVLKAAEDTPRTADVFAEIAHAAGLPAGVLNVIQGIGSEAGAALVGQDVDVISFTGSTAVGRLIAESAGRRLVKVSLELGGKNPLVVCDDADLDNAVRWILLSAFSNAGQRCAAGSRIVIFDTVYDRLRDMLAAATGKLKAGPTDGDDLGPVINARQLATMLDAVERAKTEGATVLTGGRRLDGPAHAAGFYMAPTLIEGADPKADISNRELFGPVACLYRVADFEAALAMANDSPYGLTACIHTRSFDRAVQFAHAVKAGVAVVNAGTFGSEPHMPFGGVKQSGNGSREPGTEALDIYSDLKDIYLTVDPANL